MTPASFDINDPILLGRLWYDTILLIFLGVTFVLEAFKLRANTGLGMAMKVKCATLGSLFLFAVLFVPPPPTVVLASGASWVLIGLRVVLYAVLIWEVWELMIRGWVLRDDDVGASPSVMNAREGTQNVREGTQNVREQEQNVREREQNIRSSSRDGGNGSAVP